MAAIRKDLQESVNYALMLVGAVIIIALAGAWIAGSQPVSKVDEPKFERMISSLSSYVSESRLLADEYKDQRATDNYVEVSASKLHSAVSSLADQLEEQPLDSSLKHRAEDFSEQATDLQEALGDLSRLPDSEKAGQLGKQLDHIWRGVDKLR